MNRLVGASNQEISQTSLLSHFILRMANCDYLEIIVFYIIKSFHLWGHINPSSYHLIFTRLFVNMLLYNVHSQLVYIIEQHKKQIKTSSLINF